MRFLKNKKNVFKNKKLEHKLRLTIKLLFAAICAVIAILGSTAQDGVLLGVAVVGGMYNPDVFHFRENLQKKVSKEVWWKGKLGSLTSFIDYDKFLKTGSLGSVKGSLQPTASLIHMVRDFKSKGGVKIEIPLLRPLTGQGRTGTAPLKNHSERRRLFSTKCAINMRRHAVEVRDNEMSEQVMDAEIAITMMESAAGDLKDWFSRLMPFDAYFALMTGYSSNLTDASWGLGYSQKSHPNSYVQGDGQVAFKSASGAHVAYTFDAGFEQNLATALATLTDTTSDYFNTQSIRNMVFLARQARIQPLMIQGSEIFVIFIHDAQARQLREDSVWQLAYKDAWDKGKSNPIFNGAVEGYLYEGAYIIVDSTIPSGLITGDTGFSTTLATNTTGVQYIRSNFMDSPRDAGVRRPALLLGAGGITAAEGKTFKLTEEVDDHEQKLEQGGRMIYGYSRPDIIDDDNYMGNGAGLFYDNPTSLMYWTYSPDTITI